MRRGALAKCKDGFELGSQSGGGAMEGRGYSRQGNYVRGRMGRAQNELRHAEL